MMEPMFPPTEKARAYKNTLQIVGLVHLIFSISLLITLGTGLMEMLTALMLFCGAMTYNPMCLLFYIFYMMISILTYTEIVGLPIQRAI